MKVRSFLSAYLIFFVIISSPFLLLTISDLFIPVNNDLTVYGYVFAFFASFFFTYNLREGRIVVSFHNRNLYINKLKDSLLDLGYTEKSKEGLLTTFEPLDTYFTGRKVSAYIFKDTAIIIAPKRHLRSLQQDKNFIVSALYRFFA